MNEIELVVAALERMAEQARGDAKVGRGGDYSRAYGRVEAYTNAAELVSRLINKSDNPHDETV